MPISPKGSLLTIDKNDDTTNQNANKALVYDSNGQVNEIASMIKGIQKGV